MRQGTVYVVDHDASVREGLTSLLGMRGYAVLAHTDGPSFLLAAAAAADAPACALVDAGLAGMPGLDVLAALRDARVGVPVILMTGNPEVRECVRAMRAGAIDFLTKPLHQDELLSAIRVAHL